MAFGSRSQVQFTEVGIIALIGILMIGAIAAMLMGYKDIAYTIIAIIASILGSIFGYSLGRRGNCRLLELGHRSLKLLKYIIVACHGVCLVFTLTFGLNPLFFVIMVIISLPVLVIE